MFLSYYTEVQGKNNLAKCVPFHNLKKTYCVNVVLDNALMHVYANIVGYIILEHESVLVPGI